jgi:hypothetical protein
MSAILSGHKKSSEHLANFQSWKELELRLQHMKTIDAEHLCLIKKRRTVLAANLEMADCFSSSSWHAKSCFRGTHKQLNTSDYGNFLKFVEFLALFDPLMDEHLRKIKDNETHVYYQGEDIQN